jgi:predicted outer membrane repeat protein
MNLGAGPATITLTTTLTMPNTRNITVDGTLSGGARVQISGSGASGGYLKPTLPTPNNGASVRFANVDFTNIGFTINANELALTNASFTSTRPQSDQFRAMSVSGARLTLRNVRVEGFNSGQTGAAIDARTSSGPVAAQVDAADFTVTGCSGQYGPGVFLYSQGYNAAPTLSCVRCLFANNTASVGGAAAFVGGGVATFERTLFAQNGATGVGGGLYIYPVNSGSSASVTITQSYFYANSATSSGGAIYAPTGALNLRNSAVVNNTAGGQGGGIYLSNAQFVLHSVTALDNSASNYQGVYLSSSAGASNMTNSIVYGAAAGTTAFALATGSASVRLTKNIIKGYSNTGSCPSPGLCATGTINANPLLVQVVDPQSDGGPVDTFWAPVSGCSPAVDSGDNTDGDAVDMRGAARVVGSAVDRGAVEFVPTGGNSPPVVTGAPTYTAYTGATISINAAAGLASYACDANGNSMTFSLVAQPAAGTVTVNSDGSIVFIAPQSPGAVTFLFAVSDGNQTVQGTATINVIAGELLRPPAS